MIEDVESLSRCLEVQPLGQVERLGKSDICVDQTRTKERVSFDVSKSSRVWPDVRSRYLTSRGKRGHRIEISYAVAYGVERLFAQTRLWRAWSNRIGTA